MTLFNFIHTHRRKSETLDTKTIGIILNRTKLKVEPIKVDISYTDDITRKLNKINRC